MSNSRRFLSSGHNIFTRERRYSCEASDPVTNKNLHVTPFHSTWLFVMTSIIQVNYLNSRCIYFDRNVVIT